MTQRLFLACVLLLLSTTGVSAQAQRRWELLGQRNVTDRVDHDTIPVTRNKGTFTAIRLEVRRLGVDFQRVVIHFANGDDQLVELRASIPAGGESRVIDINGGDRIIRSIDFWYDTRSIGRGGTATVRVLGRN